MPSTERTKYLKSKVVSKACHGGAYLGEVHPDLERAELWTESYNATEGEPEVVRRAKALAHTLDNMTVYIQDKELIVGNNTPSAEKLYLSPEINLNLMKEAIEDGFFVGEELDRANKITEYWKGKTMKELVEARLTDEEREIIAAGAPAISITHLDGAQHCVPNWEYVLKKGFKKIVSDINDTLEKTPEGDAKRPFYEAMKISSSAMLRFPLRYAALARQLSESEKSEERKKELLEIAAIMEHVLRSTPSSFQEALQEFFLVHITLQYIDRAGFGSLARIDQIWYPFYMADLKSGKITKESAIELMECLWIKMLNLGYWFPRKRRLHFEGNSLLQTLTVGGVHSDGTDACNELTVTILDSVRSCHNNQPTLNFRYHPKVAQDSLEAAIEVVKAGMGMPAFLHDDVMIHTLTDQGVPLEEARNWAVVGCVSACPVGCQVTTKRLAQSSITAKCLELALNDGVCVLTGKRLGPKTGDAKKFTSLEDIEEAFRRQVEFAFELGVKVRNYAREYEAEHLQRPLASSLHESPLLRGEDVSAYEDYPNLWINCVGIVDVVDSLAVLKKIVFEDKRVSLPEMIDIVMKDWENSETLRQRCINRVPKFGNDDQYVDEIAKRIFRMVALEARKQKDVFSGGGYRILPQSVSLYVSSGKQVGALPSGRKALEFLSDGGASPNHGADRKGPSAVLNSVSKLDHLITKGILLNQRFMPEALEGEEGMNRFKAYLSTWYDLGVSQIQFNVVSDKTLRAAQEEPDKYRDVIVRVAGYSAFFTQLSKSVQDAIINRRAQTFA